MYKTKLAITLDNIFISIIIFIISFVWLFRKTKNAILSFFVCNIIAVLLFVIIFKHALKKHKLQNLKNKDLKLAGKCFDTLKYVDSDEYIKYFEKLLNVTFIKNKIFKNNKLYFYIETRHELDEEDFIFANNFFLKTNKLPLCFICESANPKFIKLIENSPIPYEVYTSVDVFNLINAKKIYPFELENNSNKKTKNIQKFKTKFTQSVTKNHFKDFFFSGISLIILSLIIPYSLYYIIFGTILLILSIISLFNKTKSNSSLTKTSLVDIISKEKDA